MERTDEPMTRGTAEPREAPAPGRTGRGWGGAVAHVDGHATSPVPCCAEVPCRGPPTTGRALLCRIGVGAQSPRPVAARGSTGARYRVARRHVGSEGEREMRAPRGRGQRLPASGCAQCRGLAAPVRQRTAAAWDWPVRRQIWREGGREREREGRRGRGRGEKTAASVDIFSCVCTEVTHRR